MNEYRVQSGSMDVVVSAETHSDAFDKALADWMAQPHQQPRVLGRVAACTPASEAPDDDNTMYALTEFLINKTGHQVVRDAGA